MAITVKDEISLFPSNEHLNSVELEGAIWMGMRKAGKSFWLLCSANLMEVLIKVSVAESSMSKFCSNHHMELPLVRAYVEDAMRICMKNTVTGNTDQKGRLGSVQ